MRKTILIVDDVEINRAMLAVLLRDEYEIARVENGLEAIKLIEQGNVELAAILLDLIMPVMDGYEVLRYMDERGLMNKIPVLVISAESSSAAEGECLDMGVTDFIRKPFDGKIVRKRVGNAVELFSYKNQLEEKVIMQTEALRRQNDMLIEQAKKLKEKNEEIIDVMGTVVEYRNLESGQHIKRVKGFTRIIAERAAADYPEYELTPQKIDLITAASAMHDIGKIGVMDSVLLKPGRLTKEEFEHMKTHTVVGGELVNHIKGIWDDEAYKRVCYEICRSHHERYDGRGYPDGLAGEEIPLSAQLVSIADVYDALVSERVYKKAYTPDEAYDMILRGECGKFSPKLLDCFRKSRMQMEKLAVELGIAEEK